MNKLFEIRLKDQRMAMGCYPTMQEAVAAAKTINLHTEIVIYEMNAG